MICDPKQATNETVALYTTNNSSLMETNSDINSVFALIGATGHLVKIIEGCKRHHGRELNSATTIQ